MEVLKCLCAEPCVYLAQSLEHLPLLRTSSTTGISLCVGQVWSGLKCILQEGFLQVTSFHLGYNT